MINTVTLTDAQIKALPSGAVDIVPAQGAGKIIVPILAILHLKNFVANYTNINASAAVSFYYAGDATQMLSTASQGISSGVANIIAPGSSTLSFTLNRQVVVSSQFRMIQGIPTATASNAALQMSVSNGGAGDFTGGDPTTTLQIDIIYQVINA